MEKPLCKEWRTWVLAILVCIPLLQTVLLPWMPGLDSDKAGGGIVSHQIIHGGALSLGGVLLYTGTLRMYLVCLSFLIGGVNRLTLEIPFAIFNSLTILFIFLAVRRLFNIEAGLCVALVISVSPWFVLRDIECWYCTVLAASLYCFARGTKTSYIVGGIILGLGCYENQLAAVIPLAMLGAWLICGRKYKAGVLCVLLTAAGCAIGFSPRLLYSLLSGMSVYIEPFNSPFRALSDAIMFIPYFGGMINGTVIYLRNAGSVTYPVLPINSVIFIGAACLLIALRRQRLYRALLVFTLFLYLLPFTVIKYTAIRYFLSALFGTALITGFGIYELSLRYKKTAAAVLTLYCCANIFYISTNFFIPFARTGGNCLLFRLGNLIEASHHLVRTDVLYDCLDKDVGVIITPEPFISRNLEFYDLGKGHLKTISSSMRGGYDRFYFIDYAQSKLGIRIDPARFPEYIVTRECTGLKNFSVYHFRKRSAGSP